ncbi:MAG TPA: response regulator, partial [Rhodocyclaceae bacterium]|nr:response regulator [Rhodocyclaceae bacterium]
LGMVDNVEDIGIIVSDVVMPGQTDGRSLARTVRERHPRIFMILMSGYADSRSAEEEKPSGIPLLPKPFTREELAQVLAGRPASAGGE